MTDLRAAAQQALDCLEWHYRQGHSNTLGGFRLKMDEKALRKLRAALAEPVQESEMRRCPRCWEPMFPPQRPPLTVERLRDALVASRIVPPASVEDPDGYYDGVTLHRIELLHAMLT